MTRKHFYVRQRDLGPNETLTYSPKHNLPTRLNGIRIFDVIPSGLALTVVAHSLQH